VFLKEAICDAAKLEILLCTILPLDGRLTKKNQTDREQIHQE